MRKVFLSFILITAIFTGVEHVAGQAPVEQPKEGSPFKKCWEYPFDNTVRNALASANGTVYLAENEGRVRAISAKTSRVLWVTELGGEIAASLAVPYVGLFVVSTSPNSAGPKGVTTLRLLSFDTGLVRYATQVQFAGEIYLGTVESRLIAVDSNGSVSAFDAQSGNLVWTRKFEKQLSTRPAFSKTRIAFATSGKRIISISTLTGGDISAISTQNVPTALQIREHDSVIAGDDRGYLTKYVGTNEVIWKFKSGARITHITDTKRGLIVGSLDNFLYMISFDSGGIEWKRRLNGRLTDTPFVTDDNAFTPIYGEDSAVVINLSDGKIIDRIMLGENRYAVTGPVLTEGSILVFSVPQAIVAYSQIDCSQK